jgi:hypothetical protein
VKRTDDADQLALFQFEFVPLVDEPAEERKTRSGYVFAAPKWLPCDAHGLGVEAAPITELCPACFAEDLIAAGWTPGPALRIYVELAALRRRRTSP